jgi:hypothetical protein
MERWRTFTAPVEIVDDPSEIMVDEDGRASRAYNIKWPEGTVRKIAQGYQCLRCWEPQPKAFPENCGCCGYEMKASQARDFEAEFVGEEQFVGDAERDKWELDRLAVEGERAAWKPGQSISVGGVILPGGKSAA